MEILEENIPLSIYREMRVRCGLSAKTETAARIGLENSIYAVMVKDQDNIIGMRRVIGDGG